MPAMYDAACFLFIFSVGLARGSPDECSVPAPTLPHLEERRELYKLTSSNDDPLSDRMYILKSSEWFQVTSESDIVSHAVSAWACGTHHGIWMNGTIPHMNEGLVRRDACVVGRKSTCSKKYTIQMRNCGSYRKYLLAQPTSIQEAYCFGRGVEVDAPTHKPSKPKVVFFMKEIAVVERYEQLNFKCEFTQPSDPRELFYEIRWFINGRLQSLNSTPVTAGHLDERFLSEVTLTDVLGIGLGFQIACTVRMFYHPKGSPGHVSNKSDEFFAGLNVSTTSINVNEGGTHNIHLTLTVPFPCTFLGPEPDNCPLLVELDKSDHDHCAATVNTFLFCKKEFKRKTWNQSQTFKIVHVPDDQYIPKNDFKIFFKVRVSECPVWNNAHIPMISIHVHNEDKWQGKSCSAHSDPHILTFKGVRYDNQNGGTFTMYRYEDNDGTIFEVQTMVTTCLPNNNDVHCVCGLAVRAARDVFVINGCPYLPTPYFGFRICTENLLDVRKIDDLHYEVYLPTGTKVTADLTRYSYTANVMNIDIFPTHVDLNAEGLCGSLKGDIYEMHKRDGTPIRLTKNSGQRPNDFSLSWRVKDTENLLTMPHNKLQKLEPLTRGNLICSCNEGDNNMINCSPDRVITCNRHNQKVKETCSIRSRRSARSADKYHKKMRPNNQSFQYIPNNTKRIRRSVSGQIHSKEALVSMNSNEALAFCKRYMNSSSAFRECSEVPNINPTDAIDACALDIELTNTTMWAKASREGLKSLCHKEISQNNTLQNDTDDSGVSLVDIIKAVSCPGECNQHGVCNNGSCTCDKDYGGADCNTNVNDPPLVAGANLETGGLCDKQDCTEAILQGDLFLDSENLKCKMQRFDVDIDGNVTLLEITEVTGEHNTIFDIRCPFPHLRERRATNIPSFGSGYSIAVSNNAKNFSSSHMLYILDSTCQDTYNESGKLRFLLRAGFCFIRGICVANAAENAFNECQICSSDDNPFEWTKTVNKKGCGPVKQDSDLWMIGAVIGCISLILVLISIVCVIKKKNRSAISPPAYSVK